MKTAGNFLAAAAVALFAGAVASGPLYASTTAPEHITVTVLRGEQSPKGPDGHGDDMIIPANYVLKAGVPVTLTIVNYDEGPHTMTSKSLGINIAIKPGDEQADDTVKPVITKVTFTPQKAGVYRWHCTIPCDKGGNFWAMSEGYDGPSEDGFMAGYFVVTN